MVCEDQRDNGGRLIFWAKLLLKKGGLFGTAKSDFQTDNRPTEEVEFSRRHFVSIQPDPHLGEILAEQGFSGLSMCTTNAELSAMTRSFLA